MSLPALEQSLIHSRILPTLSGLLSDKDTCFLVGGALRDALDNRQSRDFDFATAADPGPLARALAAALHGHWFMLDANRRQSRIVFTEGASSTVCDFAPFRGPDIDADLALRDFTINAMAALVRSDGRLDALYDPLDGQQDLSRRLLRQCSAGVLFDDPLRILKGLRHSLALQLTIEADTRSTMRRAACGITAVAGERIRHELALILSTTPARAGLGVLQEMGLLHLLGRQDGFMDEVGLDLMDRAESWEQYLCQGGRGPWFREFFRQELEQGVSRSLVFKLAVWFRGQGISGFQTVLQGLRCGRAVQNAVCGLLKVAEEQAARLLRPPESDRGKALWSEDLAGQSRLALCYLALLLQRPFEQTARQLWPFLDALDRHQIDGRVPPLVNGDWMRRYLHLQGPDIGRCLEQLRLQEIEGRIHSRAQAEFFLKTCRGQDLA